MGKNALIFLIYLKFVKIRQALEVPLPDPSWLSADGSPAPRPLPRAILPTPTLLLQSLFLMKVLREKF